jgi:signal transduction histidine kinase/HAMP domain-containing protein
MNDVHLAPQTLERRALLRALRALKTGDFAVRVPLDMIGIDGEIAQAFNDVVEMNQSIAHELARIGRDVGREGQINQRMRVAAAVGSWASEVDSVNELIGDLVRPTAAVARVIESVANGDLSQRMLPEIDGLPLRGEFQRIGKAVNTMVTQLNGFASEVSRVAREVGTEGKLGGQARVPGVAGTWKDLTDNVNAMAANLTGQVRNIAEVTTAVARGDLSRKITVDVHGEILELKSTINIMVDQLNGFASEVSRVAREVGSEGKLGGQARVPGVAGTWKDLTDNVNAMAAHLTGQVRAIAEVATAVTHGDLTRSIMVEAMGEVAALKDNINEMIRNLKETTLKNDEQDWLKTNLAKFSRMLQGQGDLVAVSQLVLSELAPLVHAQQGVLYAQSTHVGDPYLEMVASYASGPDGHLAKVVRIGEGLVGQCAVEKKRILLEDVQQDYIRISSALGSALPVNVVILPVLFEGNVKAVLELASIKTFNATRLSLLEQLAESLGIVFNTIKANTLTRDLLAQSQSLTRELQKQQEELKQTNDRLGQQAENLQKSESLLKTQQEELRRANDELQHRAQLLSEQMRQVEYKNQEIELAKAALEEKAEQLALSSRYKSEFLANMSHELRTPLNSLLILAKLLADNAGDNLTAKQIDSAQTIYAAGADLLSLISDILDLAKIESGTITLDYKPLRLTDLRDYVDRTFRPTALEQNLDFTISIDRRLPTVIESDEKRLQQILKNLLSNAFKFTAKGSVELRIVPAQSGWSPGRAQLEVAAQVIAFEVADSGVGIPANKQKVIFEAFQQADGTTSRRHGGTGLGLSISRELTGLLGGEITVKSVPDTGSTFVLYLPLPKEPAVETPAPRVPAARRARKRLRAAPEVTRVRQTYDGRDNIDPGDRVVGRAPTGPGEVARGLANRKILIVDDDVRNVFALTSALEQCGMTVLNAEGGKEGLEILKSVADIEMVLMDLMMPELDGYDTIRIIRGYEQFKNLPIIAVTAKAMKGDREKCLDAGASDYIAKPVNVEQLTSLLRLWLNQ